MATATATAPPIIRSNGETPSLASSPGVSPIVERQRQWDTSEGWKTREWEGGARWHKTYGSTGTEVRTGCAGSKPCSLRLSQIASLKD